MRRPTVHHMTIAVLLFLAPGAPAAPGASGDVIEKPDAEHTQIVSNLLDRTTRDLSQAIRDYRGAAGAARDAFGQRVVDLAVERRAYMLDVMRRNPDQALGSVLSAGERAEVDVLAPGQAEQPVSLQGTLEVVVADLFADGVSITQMTLVVGVERVRLHPARGPAGRFVSGAEVRVTGYRLEDEIVFDASSAGLVADSQGGGGSGTAVNEPDATGVQQVVVLLANFRDTPQPGLTPAEVGDVVFNQNAAYYAENSYGKVSFAGTVLGWFTMDLDQTCALDQIQREAIEAADPAVDFTLFQRLVLVTPFSGCSSIGFGTLGKAPIHTDEGTIPLSTSWLDLEAATDLHVVAHEFGHNFTAHHAGFHDCGEGPIDSTPECERVEYGNVYALMGGNRNTGHWTSWSKENVAGWFEDGNVLLVDENGTYVVEPIENPTNGVQALKIPRNGQEHLFVEYKQPIGFDGSFFSNVYDGALLIVPDDNFNRTLLIDATPPSDILFAALEPGEIFTDPVSGSSVRVTAASPQQLTVDVTLGACTDFDRPTVAITEPSNGSEVSGTVTLAAEAADRDSPIDRVEFFELIFTPFPGRQIEPFGVDGEAPFSVEWDTTQVTNGNVTIFARAYDDPGPDCASNVGTSGALDLFVANGTDALPPAVALTSPADGAKLDPPFLLAADAADDTGIARVEFWVDPAGVDPCGTPAQHDGPHPPFCKLNSFFPAFSGFFPGLGPAGRGAFVIGVDTAAPYEREVFSLPPGNYTAFARAIDVTGNRTTSDTIDFIVKGSRPFRIIITGPANQSTVAAGSKVTIGTDVTADDNELGQVEFRVDGDLMCIATEQPFACEWEVPAAPGERYRIEAVAQGLGGRTDSDFVDVTAE